MGQIRVMNRNQFAKVAVEGNKMGFNRQVAPCIVKKVARCGSFGVVLLFIHEHIGGVRVEPHLLTMVGFELRGGRVGAALIDMKIETFEELPVADEGQLGLMIPSFDML